MANFGFYGGFISNDNVLRKGFPFILRFDTIMTRWRWTASYSIFKFATGIEDDYKFYISVQRWSLQNIGSSPATRNNPSIELIMKIVAVFISDPLCTKYF